ncbi:proline-rich protein 36-like isoform X2 [Portunus trituberculatus]|uniref:proline-rich protein 36-like isoform X2 n=1 Tax=Portunus trituberculatus TaxID=210409 RepID=UPI001E1CC607|nr:proline-rich protein 36-like isoform X2 [Portunus trituberculatus]
MSDECSLPPFTPPPTYEEATSGFPPTLPPVTNTPALTPQDIASQSLYNAQPQNNIPAINTPVPEDIVTQYLYNAQVQNNPPVTNTPALTPEDIATQALYNAPPQSNPPVRNTPTLTPQEIATQALYNAPPQSNPPVRNTPIQSPQAVASQALYNYQPQNNIPLYPRYDPCPTGAEVLRRLDEILIYPSKGFKYKIRNGNKVTLMTAKGEFDGDCCSSCDCSSNMKFVLYSLNKIATAEARIVIDSINCCSYSPQIFSTSGTQVGVIDNSRGVKNRLVVSRDMPVRHKILLLFFAIFLQKEDDNRRSS